MKTILYTIALSCITFFQTSSIQAQTCSLCDLTITNMIDCRVDIRILTTFTDPSTGITSNVTLQVVPSTDPSANGARVLRSGSAAFPASHNFADIAIPAGTSCSDYTITSIEIISMDFLCPPYANAISLTPNSGTTMIISTAQDCCSPLGYRANFSGCALTLEMLCP